jgi:predicted amidophosphoribosyltransferase
LTAPLTAKHVALVDDVVTTGSTANEISKLLRAAGVEWIEVWAVARAPRAYRADAGGAVNII